jgi:ectoine hydroxylase-related dioxygenase (phytanoyl-CoA dioxygenase family)
MRMLQNQFGSDVAPNTVSQAVAEDGYAIIRDAIDSATIDAINNELADHFANAHPGHETFAGNKTKRFGALLAKSTTVQQLLLHPTVLAIADQTLLPHCVNYHVHYTGVMYLEPGEKRQVMHRDTGMFPLANPCPPLTVATMWALSDFTRDNGGTRLIPGSHWWSTEREPTREDVQAAEMTAGSVLVYIGNVIHGAGTNQSNQARSGLALHYGLGWLRQEENQYLAVPQSVARTLPANVRELLGYALGSSHMGIVDHIAPDDFLQGVRDPAQSNITPPDLSERVNQLERFHVSHAAKGGPRHYNIDTD